MERTPEDLRRRGHFHDAPRVHDRDPVADLACDAEVVRHKDEAHAKALLQGMQEADDLVLDRDVKRGRRLVRKEERRLGGKSDGNHRALAHAAGELMRIGGQAFLRRRDADERHELRRAAELLGF